MCVSLTCRMGDGCGVSVPVVWVKIGNKYCLVLRCIQVVDHYVGERGGLHVTHEIGSWLRFFLWCIYRYRAQLAEGIDVFDFCGSAIPFGVRYVSIEGWCSRLYLNIETRAASSQKVSSSPTALRNAKSASITVRLTLSAIEFS